VSSQGSVGSVILISLDRDPLRVEPALALVGLHGDLDPQRADDLALLGSGTPQRPS
jgi:hypothetical protein